MVQTIALIRESVAVNRYHRRHYHHQHGMKTRNRNGSYRRQSNNRDRVANNADSDIPNSNIKRRCFIRDFYADLYARRHACIIDGVIMRISSASL